VSRDLIDALVAQYESDLRAMREARDKQTRLAGIAAGLAEIAAKVAAQARRDEEAVRRRLGAVAEAIERADGFLASGSLCSVFLELRNALALARGRQTVEQAPARTPTDSRRPPEAE
jgi:hypothetical protein